MSRSTEPLSDPEMDMLFSWARLRTFSSDWGERYYARLVLFMAMTGAHPFVLAEQRVEVRGDQLIWERPKTNQKVVFPIIPELRPWIDEFLHQLQPGRSRVSYNHDVHEAGRRAGIPELTPRSLRHTAGYMIREKYGHAAAKELLRCSDHILNVYANRSASKHVLRQMKTFGLIESTPPTTNLKGVG